MSTKYSTAHCPHCFDLGGSTTVVAFKNGVNHVLHLFLSVFTFGMWLPVWGLVSAFAAGKWFCGKCGNQVNPGARGQ